MTSPVDRSSSPPNPVDAAVGNLRDARQNLEAIETQASQGDGARAELRDGYLQQNVHDAERISRFNETSDDDSWVVNDTQQRPWFAATGVAQPGSAVQLDAVLNVLQVPVPHV